MEQCVHSGRGIDQTTRMSRGKLTDEDRWFVCCLNRHCGYSQQALGAAWEVVQQTVSRAIDADGYRERQRTQKAQWRTKPEVRERRRQRNTDPAQLQRQRERRRASDRRWRTARPEAEKAQQARRRAAGRVTAADVQAVNATSDGLCAYCLKPGANSLDHVLPISRGGTNATGNLTMACQSCNSAKRDRTPLEWIFGLPKLG